VTVARVPFLRVPFFAAYRPRAHYRRHSGSRVAAS
jgi:hypothetical protein